MAIDGETTRVNGLRGVGALLLAASLLGSYGATTALGVQARSSPAIGVLAFSPDSAQTRAVVYAWNGSRITTVHAPAGAGFTSNASSALAPDGRRLTVASVRGTMTTVLGLSGKILGRFSENYGIRWADDSVHLCALNLPAHLRPTASSRAALVLQDPGHGRRVVASVPGTGDHEDNELIACSTARHVAIIETIFMGSGRAVTYVNLQSGKQWPAPWYNYMMGSVEVSGNGRYAVTVAGDVIDTSTGKVVAHTPKQPAAISWLGHEVVLIAPPWYEPEVYNWQTHRVVWRVAPPARGCPCASPWVFTSARMGSDEVAVNVQSTSQRASRTGELWLISTRGAREIARDVAPTQP